MMLCLLGRLASALGLASGATGFEGLMHFIQERGDGGVRLAGDVFGDLHRLALGGGRGLAGFAHGRFSVGLCHRFADFLLLVGGQARKLGATVVGLLAIAFTLAGGFTPRLGFRLAAGLVGLTLFHGLADFFQNRRNGGIGFAGGFIGDFTGFLLGFDGGLLGFGGLLMRFLYGRVLIGFLHGLAEAFLFVGGERDRETRISTAFGGRSLGSDVRTRGVFGRKAEGGEEEQG